MHNPPGVFISGALSSVSGLVRLEVFYDMIAEICESRGFCAFLPYRDANPGKIEGFTNDRLYLSNMDHIKNRTDLIIAYAGLPSAGVGMEVQAAYDYGVDVIMLSEKNITISKPLLGCPAVVEHIRFAGFDEAVEKLGAALDVWIDRNQNTGNNKKENPKENET